MVIVLVPAVIVPVKLPPSVPVPVFRLRLIPVFALTLLKLPFASCDLTVTGKAVPAIGFAPPFTEVTISLAAGPATKVTAAVCAMVTESLVSVAVYVVDWATVSVTVNVTTPFASDGPLAAEMIDDPPLFASVTVLPLTGLLLEFFN